MILPRPIITQLDKQTSDLRSLNLIIVSILGGNLQPRVCLTLYARSVTPPSDSKRACISLCETASELNCNKGYRWKICSFSGLLSYLPSTVPPNSENEPYPLSIVLHHFVVDWSVSQKGYLDRLSSTSRGWHSSIPVLIGFRIATKSTNLPPDWHEISKEWRPCVALALGLINHIVKDAENTCGLF